MKNKIGFLTALAIGDSFGRAFEFATKEAIENNLDIKNYSQCVGKYPDEEGGNIGRYTDDTQMSMAITEHMLLDYPITHDFYAASFLQTYTRDKRGGYSKRIKKVLDSSKNVKDFHNHIGDLVPRNSNGSVMRCLPLGLYPDIKQLKHACVIQTTVTHPTIDCIIATTAVALSVHYLYYNIQRSYISWMSEQMGQDNFFKVYDTYTLGEEVKCDALETASFCLNFIFRTSRFIPARSKIKFDKMSQILTECIMVGGDTDSTASICLGLACIKDIKNDLNDNLFDNLENGTYGRDYIIGLEEKLLKKFSIIKQGFVI
jgi:ADP-ribosylglycohydrolase